LHQGVRRARPGTLAKRPALEQALDYLREGGPKFKTTPNRARQARAMYDARQHTVQEIADTFGVSRPTNYRHLDGTATPPPVPHSSARSQECDANPQG